ncbi:hypothetical protein GGX14DRAFT_559693 [Mycena pura]|uniref:F-box domain-containing protein n=1 Tax=Mycena pura TaxID=153505 RepID=A0AAD6YJ37_9AGAR|nr:hypothetical protein GGX14DRAFT_559693 [Mycena pura]
MTSPASSAPPEIWRLIFQFTTESDTSYDVDYLPFQPMQELQETAQSQRRERLRLQTCLSLMYVSHRFRAVAAEFLYKDVRVCDAHGLESLVAGLVRSYTDDGPNCYGSYVRRLELPSRRTKFNTETQSHNRPFPTHPIPCDPAAARLVDILWLCPRLEILVRPCLRLDAENVIFWATLVNSAIIGSLPCLQRLEWHETELDPRFYGGNNTARLREIVAQAPRLRYLFLSSDRPTALADLALPPTLRTLRLNRSHFHSTGPRPLRMRPRAGAAPAVRHLVLHTSLPSPLLDFVSAVGAKLRVLELAFSPQTTFSAGQLRRILCRTPAMEELVYYLGAPEITALGTYQAPSVRRVRLKVNPDEWNPCKPVLRDQMEILEGGSFPGLQEIVLHDPTRWFLRRELGRDLLRRMMERGCSIHYEDGSPIVFPP